MADSVSHELRKRGVKGVLVLMAARGQIVELRCEMPSCYCPRGRGHFDAREHPPSDWAPSADHYPTLKSDGGHLEASNVRLAHVLCNREDYGRRRRIRLMLDEGASFAEIAERLQAAGVRRPHGSPSWSAALARRAFVS